MAPPASARPMSITPEQIRQFRTSGALVLRQVFSSHWIDLVSSGIERNMRNPGTYAERIKQGEDEGGEYFQDFLNWKAIPEFVEFVHHSGVASIAGQLMEAPFAAFYHEHVLVKEPRTLKVTPWHADKPYYPLQGNQACSVWMPVDHVPLQSTLQFIEGSHLWGSTFHPRRFATHLNYDILSPEVEGSYVEVPSDEELMKQNVLKWEMEPGDAVVFHMNTLHGAPGNSSESTRRRVLSTRWFGEDAEIVDRPWYVQPPKYGGLKAGQPATASSEFPIIWRRE